MKRVIPSTCLAAALAFTVGLSAQAPAPYGTPAQGEAAQSGKDAGKVTVTGCLRAGEQPGSFTLANVTMADKGKETGTAGTAGAAAGATSTAGMGTEKASLALKGSPAGVTLSDHVGHTVQVTGTLSPAAPAAGATAGTAGTTTPAASDAKKMDRTLNVTALSMVSGTCPM